VGWAPHGAFALDDGDTLRQLVDGYLAECQRSRDVVEGADRDDLAKDPRWASNLRFALVHKPRRPAGTAATWT
jgi:hypothetical protein